MKLLGFKESFRVSCMFYHETKDVEMIAHVDDLFVAGCLKDVKMCIVELRTLLK